MSNDPNLSKKLVQAGKYTKVWIWTYNGVLTELEAQAKQDEAGFNMCGYGFSRHTVKDGITTWQCLDSCD